MARGDRRRQLEDEERTTPERAEIISADHYDAVIFELGGVVANTADLQFASWQEVFDNLLRTRYGRGTDPFNREEFRHFVEGRPRSLAIRSFLDARGITLPLGEELPEADEALRHDTDTVYGLAKMKERALRKRIESGQLQMRSGAEDLLHNLVRANIKTAVVSPSKMARRILDILKIRALFDVIVDGQTLEGEGLLDEPDTDFFVEALTRLGVTSDRAAVIEDARPVVEASRNSGFRLIAVVGGGNARQKKVLLRRGADLVIDELNDLRVSPGPPMGRYGATPGSL